MKAVSFYHKESGLLSGNHLLTSDDAAVKLNTPPDHVAIEGHHDHLSKRVDVNTKEVIDYQPPQPSQDHEWDADKKRWTLTAAAQAFQTVQMNSLVRVTQLAEAERHLVRRLVLNPSDAAARAALVIIDDQIEGLISGSLPDKSA